MSDSEDVEDMLEKWGNLEDLSVAGLHVLRDVVEKAIEERTKDLVDYKTRVPLPPDPRCVVCWSCQTWINPGEKFFRHGETSKSYHHECRP